MFYKSILHRFNPTIIKQTSPRLFEKWCQRFSSIFVPELCSAKIKSSFHARDYPYMYTDVVKQIMRSFSNDVNTNHHDSTIFSLSSGHGKCGVAVIRVSGPSACDAMETVAQMNKKSVKPRKATLRRLVDPFTGVKIDIGLVLFFPAPDSFTGEDCVEFQVHGGPAVVSALLSTLHKIPNCRQAEPGEFTKRAFFNGKMDLTEIEGLGDLIHAETEAQRRQALRQMDGDLSKLYTQWRTKIIKCVADLEAFIDFSEDQNIEDSVIEQVKKNVTELSTAIRNHINDNRQGEILREGVHVVILGQPNVGKSSLLNSICQRPAAIVTNVAGTTRDVIETHVNIGGYPVLLSDTAGLRDTDDIVEKEGVSRALKRAKEADVKIIILDVKNQDINKDSDINKLIYDKFKDLFISDGDSDSKVSSKLTDLKEKTASKKDGSVGLKLSRTEEQNKSVKDDKASLNGPTTKENIDHKNNDIKEVNSVSDLFKNGDSESKEKDFNQLLYDTNTIIVFNKIDLVQQSEIVNLENIIHKSNVGIGSPVRSITTCCNHRNDGCCSNDDEYINNDLVSDEAHIVEPTIDKTAGVDTRNKKVSVVLGTTSNVSETDLVEEETDSTVGRDTRKTLELGNTSHISESHLVAETIDSIAGKDSGTDNNLASSMCTTSQISVSDDNVHTRYVKILKHKGSMDTPCCFISCTNGDGMEDFLNILTSKVAHLCGNPLTGHPTLTQSRHRQHLLQCLSYMEEFQTLSERDDLVLASETLRWSLQEIGKITGKISSEDILDVIFKDFCIGK